MNSPVRMFRPRPEIGLGRRWHVFDRELYGFMLVAPFPCTFVQAGVISERVELERDRIVVGDVAVLERRICRHCITAVRGKVA